MGAPPEVELLQKLATKHHVSHTYIGNLERRKRGMRNSTRQRGHKKRGVTNLTKAGGERKREV